MGFVEAKIKVESFIEETIFEDNGVVLNGGDMEFYVVGTENGTVAKELEEAHAVFYYAGEGTH